jgi:hypothetical protein
MAKIWLLLGTLVLAGACSGVPSDCEQCVALGACSTATSTTETCGVGLVCCPPVAVADAG